ncbi:hypothetical protein OOT00_05160 [Desulfobotulus sp. H1]|uniref:Chromosome partitioning protein ParA n=1 Tax=Desulfobotulus pelophilus TaxID=2823377 RepID=A0ABT3N7E0_9BACT|nr:hypothetical protein [Desulfobotulus pelophilus]MCW7753373.1 hypothetical protein [Desulfobotulus pelophilus]
MPMQGDHYDTAFEMERLQKRMDGVSFRLTLAILVIAGLLGGLFFISYSKIRQELKEIQTRQAEVLSGNKPLSQQLFALEAKQEEVAERLSLTRGMLQTLQNETKQLADRQTQDRSELTRKLASVEAREIPDAAAIENLKTQLTQTSRSLQTEQGERRKMATELASLKKDHNELRQAGESQATLLAQISKNIQEQEAATRKEIQALRQEQQALRKAQESPEGMARKSDLDALARRNENDRIAMENRINRKFQQLQVSLDAALRGGMPGTNDSTRSSSPILQQEVLQE